jgi:hypothetical protein
MRLHGLRKRLTVTSYHPLGPNMLLFLLLNPIRSSFSEDTLPHKSVSTIPGSYTSKTKIGNGNVLMVKKLPPLGTKNHLQAHQLQELTLVQQCQMEKSTSSVVTEVSTMLELPLTIFINSTLLLNNGKRLSILITLLNQEVDILCLLLEESYTSMEDGTQKASSTISLHST